MAGMINCTRLAGQNPVMKRGGDFGDIFADGGRREIFFGVIALLGVHALVNTPPLILL